MRLTIIALISSSCFAKFQFGLNSDKVTVKQKQYQYAGNLGQGQHGRVDLGRTSSNNLYAVKYQVTSQEKHVKEAGNLRQVDMLRAESFKHDQKANTANSFLIQPYVKGGQLKDAPLKIKPQVCGMVIAAMKRKFHDKGLCHGDLHAGNVIITGLRPLGRGNWDWGTLAQAHVQFIDMASLKKCEPSRQRMETTQFRLTNGCPAPQ